MQFATRRSAYEFTVSSRTTRFANFHRCLATETLEQPAEWNRLSTIHARYARTTQLNEIYQVAAGKRVKQSALRRWGQTSNFSSTRDFKHDCRKPFPCRASHRHPPHHSLLSPLYLFTFNPLRYFFLREIMARSRKSTRFMSPSSDPPSLAMN